MPPANRPAPHGRPALPQARRRRGWSTEQWSAFAEVVLVAWMVTAALPLPVRWRLALLVVVPGYGLFVTHPRARGWWS